MLSMDGILESSPPGESSMPRKRKKGRSARRRQAKIRAIQKVEQSLWENGGESVEEDVLRPLVPIDREKVWPGVLERRKGMLGKPEKSALVGQLGYLPGNAVEIAARARVLPSLSLDKETPLVLKLYPLAVRDAYAGGKSDGRKFKGRKRGSDHINSVQEAEIEVSGEETPLLEPFPTLYWVTHPLLRTLISKLEMGATHNVRIMQERLRGNEEALASMKRAHHAYGTQRWEVLTTSDLREVESRKWQTALNAERGVAGIRRHDRVKCLHAHAAHYLSGGKGSAENVVGKWVIDAVLECLKKRDEGKKG